MYNKINNILNVHEVLSDARIGMWIIELGEDCKPKMYADNVMMEILGIEGDVSPEMCYEVWYHNIEEKYVNTVNRALVQMRQEGRTEVEYLWNHPYLGSIYIRCGGIRDVNCEDGETYRGYHQNITFVTTLREEKEELETLNEEILASLQKLFFAIYRLDCNDDTIKPLIISDNVLNMIDGECDYSEFISFFEKQLYSEEDAAKFRCEMSLNSIDELIQGEENRLAGEYRIKWGSEYRWVTISVYLPDNTESRCAILALQDINEQREKEKQNRIAIENACANALKANAAKGDFLSKMSHDIRTPLNAIIGMTTIAEANIQKSEKIVDCIHKIKSSGLLLLELVNEILDMSKMDSNKIEINEAEFSIGEMIDNVIASVVPIFDMKEQEFVIDIETVRHDILLGDMLRIQQVLMNILSNAGKYTQAGGIISLTIQELGKKDRYASYEFKIQDNGIGMSKEFIQHIFEPFVRAEDSRISKISGSGLGMTITKNLVQMMNGLISVDSELEKGSCFTVALPLKIQDESTEVHGLKNNKKLNLQDVDLNGKRLLVVEDNEINREIAKEFLEMAGAAVETASDGREAVEKFVKSPINYYSAIFMDIKMPFMDGNSASMAIRASRRLDAFLIPIIAMSANAFMEDVILTRHAGMNDYISKPIDSHKLAEVLQGLE